MYIDTSCLIPTHNKLRHPYVVDFMLSDLSELDKSLEISEDKISVGEIEGNLYVFNSHHRMAAVNIAYGRIKESYLNIKSYTLEEMLTPNLEIGWITPFDPHFFCRIPDFKAKKELILNKYMSSFDPFIDGTDFFKKESESIIEPRLINTFEELYNV